MKIILLLRSALFQIYFYASVCFFATLVALSFFLPFNVRFMFARAWGKSMLFVGRWLLGFRWQVEGRENIPDEPSVILIKHSTVFETYAQLAIFPPQTWVLKRELLWIPIFGWGLACMKPIAINRGAGSSAVKQVISIGKERLKAGIWLTVFPEGTRVMPGKTKKYGISGAALAHAAAVPVLPVAHNAGDLWQRRGVTRKAGLIRIVIGPPIDGAAQSPKETNALAQDWIETKMAEISPEAYGREVPPAD